MPVIAGAARWRPVLIAMAAAIATATAGKLVSDLGPWYLGLRQPSWKPPDLWFGPAWTLIFALAATAGVRAWWATHRSAPAQRRSARRWLIGLFAANAVLNFLWSFLFFYQQRPDWALIEVGFLWASILALIVTIGRYERAGAALLLPYLAWVTFASGLTAAIVELNEPFSGL